MTEPERAQWERVQAIERAYHARKRPEQTLTINRIYWRRILDVVQSAGVTVEPDSRVLDMGCGGAGILHAIDRGHLIGVDPLMDFYLARFPALADAPATWLTGTAEDFQAAAFDVVFCINALDHVRSPARAAANLTRLVANGGHLVLQLNAHTTRLAQRYFTLFHHLLDPPHPHQLHRDDVASLFPDLDLVKVLDVDHLWLDLDARYRTEALRPASAERPLVEAAGAAALRLPLLALRLLGRRPVHRRRPEDRPLMATHLFVFQRPD